MKKLKIGDVLQINLTDAFAYGQYTHKHSTLGYIIRVFEGIHKRKCSPIELVSKSILYYILIHVPFCVKNGSIEVVGNIPLESTDQNLPLFRVSGIVSPNHSTDWFLWENGKRTKITKLTNKIRKLSILQAVDDSTLRRMIENNWTPEGDI